MIDVLFKVFGFIIDFFWPGKVKEFLIKVKRLDITNMKEIEDFIDVYEEHFMDSTNYTSEEMLEYLRDPQNSKKHVKSDNITLIAKYKDSVIGFILCFYYPKKKCGIIGYLGKSPLYKEEKKYVVGKLLKGLKKILIHKYNCELIVFELASKRDIYKFKHFSAYSSKMGYKAYELLFEYYRPKLNLNESENEERLRLIVIPLKRNFRTPLPKNKVLDILSFLHFYCYGDYYEKKDPLLVKHQQYMQDRIKFYEKTLPDKVLCKIYEKVS